MKLVEQDEDGVDDFFAVCSCELGVKGELRFGTKKIFLHQIVFIRSHLPHPFGRPVRAKEDDAPV